jgi:methylenetetrahydrofolate--tRNA-(uracil-5-)-methyltransferase
LLDNSLRLRISGMGVVAGPVWLAGQITGTEGYVGSAMSGLVAGLNAAFHLRGRPPLDFPPTTMIGALLNYISGAEARDFQPMKANFGLLPPLNVRVAGKRDRNTAYARRSLADLFSPQEAIAAIRSDR